MSYDYHAFIHPVPCGSIIPKGTKARCVDQSPYFTESFFTTLGDFEIPYSGMKTYYLDYDIEAATPPLKINSVIYNVHAIGGIYSVAVHQGNDIWSAYSVHGSRTTIYTPEIKSFDTTPPKEEAYS